MAVLNTPALKALQDEIGSLPAKKADAPAELSQTQVRNRRWRDKLRGDGGRITSLVLTPVAVQSLEALKDDSVHASKSQSELVSDAVMHYLGTPPPGLTDGFDERSKFALEAVKADWGVSDDAEAIRLALRGFVQLVGRYNVTDIELGGE